MENYQSLKNKYGGFEAPAFWITAGTEKLEEYPVLFCRMEICLDPAEGSRGEVELAGCYDRTSRAIFPKLRKAVSPGTKITVSLGYKSSGVQVFSGFIERVRAGVNGEKGFYLVLEIKDAIELMKRSSHQRVYTVRSYEEAFEEVVKPYSGYCSAAVKKGETAGREKFSLYQYGSGYDFIKNILEKDGTRGLEFCLDQKEAYFGPPKEGPVILEAAPDEGILEMELYEAYVNASIRTVGLTNEGTMAEAIETVRGRNTAAGSFMWEETFAEGAVSQNEAAKAAEARMKKRAGEQRGGRILMTGIPEAKPGTCISIYDMDPNLDQVYEIISVCHRLDEKGFTTELTVRGKGI